MHRTKSHKDENHFSPLYQDFLASNYSQECADHKVLDQKYDCTITAICIGISEDAWEHLCFSAIFTKGNNFCDFLFASLGKKKKKYSHSEM